MKLIYRIISRLSVALFLLMTGWAVAFYFIITDEINDETDDTLEEYAHYLIARALAGEELPSNDNGSNNTYYLTEVSGEFAAANPAVRYADEDIYIWSKMETEPARILKTIFRDSENRFYQLTVAVPSFEKWDLQSRILGWILLLYALMLGTVIAVNALIIRRSFRPLYVLLEWMGNLRLGHTLPPLDAKTDITEFRLLNEAAEHAIRRAGEMYDEQRLFTGNAAHELQTPIAVCRSRLELLAGDQSLSEAQLEQIGSLLGTLDRLAGLNRTLLLLTRIDNRQFPDSVEVDAGKLIKSLAEDYSEVYSHRNLSVEVREKSAMKMLMNETLASVLFNNLLKNAFAYTPEGGRIEAVVTSRSVSVSNSAAGGPLDPVVIFRRFYRGGGAGSAASENSAGLGLAIVESVCRLYGFRISYEFVESRHVFTVII